MNITLMPVMRCAAGCDHFYICNMKYAEVARQVGFAHELSANQELGQLIQRGISDRTKHITEYLMTAKHRFLGGLVVAVWGGEPMYRQLSIQDPDGMLQGLDRGFGVLTFDGTQQYFVLDGQHRLRAIKDAIKQTPELGKEDICVLIVTHYDSPDGRIRTRRLFSNINRNAVKTAAAEDIVLDEDDGFAVLTRRMLDEHEFLKTDGRVKVISKAGGDGVLKLAGNSISKTDPKALTTLSVLYDVLKYLGWDLPGVVRDKKARPSSEVLESSFEVLRGRLDDLLTHCGKVRTRLEAAAGARELRAPKNAEGEGHPFLRPVIQKAVARVAGELVQQGLLGWPQVMGRLAELDWRLAAAPWTAVYQTELSKMLTVKENATLLGELLHAHLAPLSMATIKRARKGYKDLRNQQYSVSEEELGKRLPTGEVKVAPPVEHSPELSEQVEGGLAASSK